MVLYRELQGIISFNLLNSFFLTDEETRAQGGHLVKKYQDLEHDSEFV